MPRAGRSSRSRSAVYSGCRGIAARFGLTLSHWATPHPDSAKRAAARQVSPSPAEGGERGSDAGPIRSLTVMRWETRAAERDSVPFAEPLSHRALCQSVSQGVRLSHRFYSSAVECFRAKAFGL